MSSQDLTGKTIGPYEIRSLIGAGGMGKVYRAYQTTLAREVAIKIFSDLEQDESHKSRFEREARTAASLEHSHIVPVYDYGVSDGTIYIVMKLLTGGSLQQIIQRISTDNQPLSLQRIARITAHVASALTYAHQRGVIHRDVKPSNILFDNNEAASLSDFGIAKILSAVTGLTSTGMAIGTPGYMAPEQWQGAEVTPAADQYALAVIVYEALTGRAPFEANTPFALMHKHLAETHIPMTKWRGDLPVGIEEVVTRGLHKDPQQRFPTVTAFASALTLAVEGLPSSVTNASPSLKPAAGQAPVVGKVSTPERGEIKSNLPELDKPSKLPFWERMKPLQAIRTLTKVREAKPLNNPASLENSTPATRNRQVFISYRRSSSAMLATLLNKGLREHNIESYVDTLRSPRGGSFPDRLMQAIQDSDMFICLLSNETLDAEWVLKEIEHAHTLNKVLIPVLQEDWKAPSAPLEPYVHALLHSDGVKILDKSNVYIDEAIGKLAAMIKGTHIN